MTMDNVEITVFRPTEQVASLRPLPDHARLVAFEAVQRGTECAYQVEITFQYEGGPAFGVNVPASTDPFDLRFMVERKDGDEDWPYCEESEPLYAGSELTLMHITPHLRNFVENNFHWREG
jgi:hypothetical protein